MAEAPAPVAAARARAKGPGGLVRRSVNRVAVDVGVEAFVSTDVGGDVVVCPGPRLAGLRGEKHQPAHRAERQSSQLHPVPPERDCDSALGKEDSFAFSEAFLGRRSPQPLPGLYGIATAATARRLEPGLDRRAAPTTAHPWFPVSATSRAHAHARAHRCQSRGLRQLCRRGARARS